MAWQTLFTQKTKDTTTPTPKTKSYGLIRLLAAATLIFLLPFSTNAQDVDVDGFVPSKVDPTQSSVVADPNSIPADGVSTSVVTVTLRDSGGSTLPNIEVTLTSSRGGLDTIGHYVGTVLTPGNSYTSDANGVVKFGVRSSTIGSSIVSAVAESLVKLNDRPTITFTTVIPPPPAIDPDLSTVVADPTTILANGTALTTITVTLRNINGAIIIGRSITLISSRGVLDSIGYYNSGGGSLVTGNSFITNSNGQVKFGISSTTAGVSTYSATAIESNGSTVPLTNKPTVTFTKVPVVDDEPPPPDDEPPIVPGTTKPPPTTIEKIVDFFQENAGNANNTLAGLGALTTLVLLPTLTTSLVTAILQNIPLLNFLLTSWLPIRKRNRWGTVRDQKTGVPVGGIEVELFKVGGTQPYLKYRTDQTGQYGFLIEETGNYFLSITNPLYLDFKSDPFTISRPSQIISLDIPLAANVAEQVIQAKKARRYLDWAYYLNYVSVILVSVGTIVAVYAFLIEPTTISSIVLGLYAFLWSLKLFYYIKYRYYGAVVAVPNDKPLPAAIIQLTGVRQGIQALVHSTISDSRGRFLFIVKPAKYSMIVAKEGYEPAEAEVDEKRIAQTIRLRPSANDEILNRPAAV